MFVWHSKCLLKLVFCTQPQQLKQQRVQTPVSKAADSEHEDENSHAALLFDLACGKGVPSEYQRSQHVTQHAVDWVRAIQYEAAAQRCVAIISLRDHRRAIQHAQ